MPLSHFAQRPGPSQNFGKEVPKPEAVPIAVASAARAGHFKRPYRKRPAPNSRDLSKNSWRCAPDRDLTFLVPNPANFSELDFWTALISQPDRLPHGLALRVTGGTDARKKNQGNRQTET